MDTGRNLGADIEGGDEGVTEDTDGDGFSGIDLQMENEKVEDWNGSCRKCGMHIVGPLAAFREHVCADKPGSAEP